MIHIMFNRPAELIKAFDDCGRLWRSFKGEGDAWGRTDGKPYGFEGWMPPGHFMLGNPDRFDSPINSEGFGQIPVSDVSDDVLQQLVRANKAVRSNDGQYNIGGIIAKTGQLEAFNRSAIMMHGGGSDAPDPLADYQQLCKTEGCTRLYNADWKIFASWLATQIAAGNNVIYSALGNPVLLPT